MNKIQPVCLDRHLGGFFLHLHLRYLALLSLATCYVAGTKAVSAADFEPLVHQVIAGIDANVSLITQGRASYDSPTIFFSVLPGAPERVTVDTVFIGDSVRWKNSERWNLWDADAAYGLQPPDGRLAPRRTNVIKKAKVYAESAPWSFHPRTLGHGVDDMRTQMRSMSEYLRSLDDMFAVDATWVGESKDSVILVTVRFKPEAYPLLQNESLKDYKMEAWIDSNQGYGIVELKKWGHPAFPFHHSETSYKRVTNGAWVAETHSVHNRNRKWDKEKVVGVRESKYEILLKDIDLSSPVDPGELTLTAMGVPRGARVQDRIANREYRHEVAEVLEEDVEREQ